MGLGWAGTLLGAAPPARADQVATPDTTYTKVTVVGYVDGDLHLRLPDGSMKPVPLAEAGELVIDSVSGLADLNEAERYLSQKRLPEAATRYERALRQADDYWVPVIHHRLLQVYDQQGKLDRAVTHFVKVAEDSPVAAARVLPLNMPSQRNAATQRAIHRLTTASRNAADHDGRSVLDLLLYAIMLGTDHRASEARALQIARLDLGPAIATAGVQAIKITALDRLRADGQHDEVLLAVEAMLPGCGTAVLPEVLLLRGRAWLDRAADRQDLLRAGLAFMRVAIHFPDSDLAPEALYWAAEVHERLERPGPAVRLLSECLAHDRIGASLRDRAASKRSRLSGGPGA